MGVCGSGEGDKYLEKTLKANLPLVDKMIVWGDAPDAKTEQILLSFDKVEYHRYPESIWAQKQWLIKESLFNRYVLPHHPDWILSFDFDEIFDYRITREELDKLAGGKATSFYFNFVQLWNDEVHMRVDAGWGDFWNVRFWKFQPHMDQGWLRKALHCGLAPVYAYNQGIFVPYIVKHFGYLDANIRKQKIERYDMHDPQRVYQSKRWYDSMRSEGDVRKFNEEKYITTILPQLMPKYQKETKMVLQPMSIKKIYMVRRKKDQRIQEMGEGHYKELLANGEFKRLFELIEEVKTGAGLLEAPVVATPVEEMPDPIGTSPEAETVFQCDECEMTLKSKAGLSGHKRFKHAPNKVGEAPALNP